MMSQPAVGILGTGEMACALGVRLQKCGVPFRFGSRCPSRPLANPILDDVEVADIEDCCLYSDLVILCLYPHQYNSLRTFEHHLVGKTLVDVSNASPEKDQSNAEKLARLLPKCNVVKAFNTVSARSMISGEDGRSVLVCGDRDESKQTVLNLANRMGFVAVDRGGLSNSRELENLATKLFIGWGWPCIVVLVATAFWIIFTMCRHFKLRKDPYSVERLPLNMSNKVLGATAATCICLVYIPGSIAAFIQLISGNKNRELPRFLKEWLSIRQKLGLLTFFLTCLHLLFSLALMSPAYFTKWYLQTKQRLHINDTYVDLPITTRMSWIGETVVLMGLLGFACMVIQALSTVPGISRQLSWREWTFIHSHLSFFTVLFVALHLTVKGAPFWVNQSARYIIPTITFLSCVLPWFTVGIRVVLYMPCIYSRLWKIRNGLYDSVVNSVGISKRQNAKQFKNNQGELSVVV